MNISVVDKKDNKVTFVIKDSSAAFANTLRRTILSELEVLAIHSVDFFENSSAFYDEYVALRLGLVPLKTGAKPPKEAKFSLVKKGPGTVYSGDLKPASKVPVADDKIPIAKLNEGQKIKLEATATLGTGKDHAKWQPGVVAYSYDNENEITFTVESNGAMSPKDMVLGALDIIKGKSKEFSKQLK